MKKKTYCGHSPVNVDVHKFRTLVEMPQEVPRFTPAATYNFFYIIHGWLCVLVDLFDVLWFLSVRMKKQELCHIYVCFHGWLCVLIDLFDVFMVFVSENGKTETFSLSWIIESNGGRSMTLPSCCCSMQMLWSRNSISCCCSRQMLWVSRKQLDHVFPSQPISESVTSPFSANQRAGYILAAEGI